MVIFDSRFGNTMRNILPRFVNTIKNDIMTKLLVIKLASFFFKFKPLIFANVRSWVYILKWLIIKAKAGSSVLTGWINFLPDGNCPILIWKEKLRYRDISHKIFHLKWNIEEKYPFCWACPIFNAYGLLQLLLSRTFVPKFLFSLQHLQNTVYAIKPLIILCYFE